MCDGPSYTCLKSSNYSRSIGYSVKGELNEAQFMGYGGTSSITHSVSEAAQRTKETDTLQFGSCWNGSPQPCQESHFVYIWSHALLASSLARLAMSFAVLRYDEFCECQHKRKENVESMVHEKFEK